MSYIPVNIKDLTAPAIACPADLRLDADSSLGTVATWNDVDFTLSDFILPDVSEISIICATFCDAAVGNCVYAPGNNLLFPIGSSEVICFATDSAANPSANCKFNVIVEGK